MSKIKWFESVDFKYDKFQAFWDFEFDFTQSNEKLQNSQSFKSAWEYQQKEIDRLKEEIKSLKLGTSMVPKHHFDKAYVLIEKLDERLKEACEMLDNFQRCSMIRQTTFKAGSFLEKHKEYLKTKGE